MPVRDNPAMSCRPSRLLSILSIPHGISWRLLMLTLLLRVRLWRRLLVHLWSRIVGQRLRPIWVRVGSGRGPSILIKTLCRGTLDVVIVVALSCRRWSSSRVEPRRPRLLNRRTARIWPSLLLLLHELGRWDLLATRCCALLLARMVAVSLAAVVRARSGRGVLVAVVTAWWRSRGWRSVHLRHARGRRRHCIGAPILTELGRRN